MGIKDRLMQDLKDAMKQGDGATRDTIRTLRSAIRNAEIDSGKELSDEEAMAIIAKQAKQRRDSMEQFRQGNRPDLVAAEERELVIIDTYLPQQLTDEEIELKAKAAIATMGVTDMKGMGKVMGKLSQELKGQADGKRISDIVKQLLSA